MDIHKPHPFHGWREFLKEYGIIVLGVLTALAGEQTVETLHHRSEAREMTEKLKAESEANFSVINFDAARAKRLQAQAEQQMRLVGGKSVPDPIALGLPNRPVLLQPSDSAWMSIRDSALLPIMPKALIADYWKIDSTHAGLAAKRDGLVNAYHAAEAGLLALKLDPENAGLKQAAILRLADLQQDVSSYLWSLEFFRRQNELVLKGQALNLDNAREMEGAGG